MAPTWAFPVCFNFQDRRTDRFYKLYKLLLSNLYLLLPFGTKADDNFLRLEKQFSCLLFQLCATFFQCLPKAPFIFLIFHNSVVFQKAQRVAFYTFRHCEFFQKRFIFLLKLGLLTTLYPNFAFSRPAFFPCDFFLNRFYRSPAHDFH